MVFYLGVYVLGRTCANTPHTNRALGPHRSSGLAVEAWGQEQLPPAMLHGAPLKHVLAPGLGTSWSRLSILP